MRNSDLRIRLLEHVRGFDIDSVNIECNRNTLKKLKFFNESVISSKGLTTNPILIIKNRRYYFLGIPIFIRKSINDGELKINPSEEFIKME